MCVHIFWICVHIYLGYVYTFWICASILDMYIYTLWICRASQVVIIVKNPLENAKELRDKGSIPGLGRSPGGVYGNPLPFLPGESH